jgi:hypothetical protein
LTVRLRLFLASALMLFLELSLIRWAGANVLHLSYFSNFVLLGSFLGIGLGLLRASHGGRSAPLYSPVALLGLVGFVAAYPVSVEKTSADVIFFSALGTTGPPIWVTLPVLFLAVAAIMAGPGELVGSCFGELERLEAYRLDLLGSIVGIVAFTGLSFFAAPPLVWFAIVCALYVVLLARSGVMVPVTVSIALLATLAYPQWQEDGTFWSPYYKVTTFAQPDGAGGSEWQVYVNGTPHQRLTTAATRVAQEGFYAEPYRSVPAPPERVLIVGAGTGTDVAIALANGAQQVDAVEIDPALLGFGEINNPDRAYDDPRVTTHVDDGRAFLERTDEEYDLILFALPDSLTLVSGASSLRLESYLFTESAFASARAHLAPGGAFAIYNYYREQWLVDRLAGTLDTVFGHSPCLFQAPQANQLAVMVSGVTPDAQVCTTTWDRASAIDVPPPATDDRPFLYVETNAVPGLYVVVLLLILLASLGSVLGVLVTRGKPRGEPRGAPRREDGRIRGLRSDLRSMWSYRDLFLLGAAFLLLETKSVTGFALLFGTTWVVNSLVFVGVLLAVLAAVEVTRRRSTPPVRLMYAILLGSLAFAWLVPASWLLAMPVPLRLAAAVVIAFLPVFAANVIFAKRFADSASPTLALGTNLLGAMVGGCLEYLALATGYRMLLVLAAGLYLGAYALTPRQPRYPEGRDGAAVPGPGLLARTPGGE